MKRKNQVSKQERIARKEAMEALVNVRVYRIIIAVIMAAVGVFTVAFIGGNGMRTFMFVTKALTPVSIVLGALTAAAAVFCIVTRLKGTDESLRVISSVSLTVYAAVAFMLSVSYYFIDVQYDTTRIVTLIVLAVLYIIYNIFNTEFFVASAQCALGVLAMNILSKSALSQTFRIFVAAAAVFASVIIGYIVMSVVSKYKNDAKGKRIKFYVMSAIIIAGVVLSLFITGIASYAIFTLLAAYLVIAVISAIEMM